MTYQPNIPLATDFISVSQQDINNNFTSLGTAFDTNHVDFNASGAGKHKFVELPNQSGNPAGAATEITLYSKQAAGSSELFMRRDAGSVIQMSVGVPNAASSGTTFLPGGIIMKWGSVVGSPSGNTATFSTPFPNNVFSLTLGIFDTNVARTASFSALTNTNVLIKSSNVNTVYYIAIGN